MEREELKLNEDSLLKRSKRTPAPTNTIITLNTTYCKGCGLCVDVCPTGSLLLVEDPCNKWGGSVKVDAPEYCIGCKMCELRCPDFAIFVNSQNDKEGAK